MLNIVLTRIDDRLIHGQVMTAWVKYTQANRIIIVDDNVAQDPFMEKVLKMAAPPGIKVEVYDTQKAVAVLKGEGSPGEKVIVLAKHPKTIYALMEGGVGIKELNVGGMGAGAGRKLLYKNISASQEEREVFKNILSKGVAILIRIVPDDKGVEIKKFL
ncbi:PTS mannose/fructose/sorbose transporter subunit IIB [Biomaibacter acetigenes]|jgi:PTS system mannose-specific IIB component|uniref:PTS mannose/fructose/sorbose transporter subunit IIB n=1 Tax=Biomaibacter acetigenes TaxID=2316383 RepID=A0A3G2R7E5_9FIRM|nr:PTS sugar transporter subunit IIB [Biomaibacter acetigenes]AYO31323.1 PTS mannose/fructose/sorbose transporter subunit IIB [Biomaibacter acetigenes]MDN5311238.1 D-glucosaminate system component [Thermoanaerobacteraceae bacterium]